MLELQVDPTQMHDFAVRWDDAESRMQIFFFCFYLRNCKAWQSDWLRLLPPPFKVKFNKVKMYSYAVYTFYIHLFQCSTEVKQFGIIIIIIIYCLKALRNDNEDIELD